MNVRRHVQVLGLLSAVGALAGESGAQSRACNVALESSRGGTRRLREFTGRPLVVIDEDRAATGRNAALVADLTRPGALPADARIVPVADLTAYHFWPAEHFARDAVRERASRDRIEILIDWTGEFRAASGFSAGISNVAVIGRDGVVRFRHSGTLTPDQRAAVLAAAQ